MTTDSNNDYERREQREEEREERDLQPATPGALRGVYAAIMVIVYVGMGILLLCNFFDFNPQFDWVRYGGGVILIIYGIYRAYRYFKGTN